MTLPPKALQVLVDLKKSLVCPATSPAIAAARAERTSAWREEKATKTFSGRRAKPANAFQRGCQRRAWWSPVH
jgi:hypothetical protein